MIHKKITCENAFNVLCKLTRTVLILSFLLAFTTISCNDKWINDCSDRFNLEDQQVQVLDPIILMDTLIYQMTKGSFVDTLIYVKKRVFEDVLKFSNPRTITKECDVSPDLFLERFHAAYYSSDMDSIVFDVIKDWTNVPCLFFHHAQFSMSIGYNSCFFCVPPDSAIEVNGVMNNNSNRMNGTVISKNPTFNMHRCLGYDGKPIATIEALKKCRGYFDQSKGLVKWAVNENSDSLAVYELIN